MLGPDYPCVAIGGRVSIIEFVRAFNRRAGLRVALRCLAIHLHSLLTWLLILGTPRFARAIVDLSFGVVEALALKIIIQRLDNTKCLIHLWDTGRDESETPWKVARTSLAQTLLPTKGLQVCLSRQNHDYFRIKCPLFTYWNKTQRSKVSILSTASHTRAPIRNELFRHLVQALFTETSRGSRGLMCCPLSFKFLFQLRQC